MVLDEYVSYLNVLKQIRNGLMDKGYSYKVISFTWLNSQIEVIEKIIKKESFNLLSELLRKTNYRLLITIDKGIENLPDIYLNPYDWQLGRIEENREQWLNDKSLIFSTETRQLVFSKDNLRNGQKYINNKWQ